MEVDLKRWEGKTGTVKCFGKCVINESDVIRSLGEPHFVEDDPTRTRSGTEMYWAFETEDGDALAFTFHQIIEELYVGTNGDQAGCKEIVDRQFQIPFLPEHGVLWD